MGYSVAAGIGGGHQLHIPFKRTAIIYLSNCTYNLSNAVPILWAGKVTTTLVGSTVGDMSPGVTWCIEQPDHHIYIQVAP